ncbi:unnamed protein product [Heterobilharzia americana]|nr:unnamed protein product [Heterobilharzia americana]
MRLLSLALTSLHACSVVLSSYEEYVILPVNSDYCQDHSVFRRFSLSRQMSFVTGVYNSSWNNLLYACKIKVHPNGRLLHYSYPEGHTSYWFHRLRISINFTTCKDFLTVGFIPEEITQPSLLPYEINVTCSSIFPQIIDSKHRIVSLIWHTESGSVDEVKSQLDVQMSAYMRFEGSFSLLDKMRRCEVGSGFWCGNETAVCVYGQMRCDQADGCFDGGTDEIGCPPIRNYTYIQPRRPMNSWSVYLPWTALGIIPLILIFALGLICAPRKSLDGIDDDESQEEEGLKTVFSPMTSSSAASPSLSESSSPRSIQSIAVCSAGEKMIVCDSELTRSLSHPGLSDPIHETIGINTIQKKQSYLLGSKLDSDEEDSRIYHQRRRLNYNPNSYELSVDDNIHKQNCTKENSVAYSNELLKPSKSRAVTFQLPHNYEQESLTDLYQDTKNVDPNNKQANGSHVIETYQQKEQSSGLGYTTQQTKSKSKRPDSRAIPASFEMAALRVRMINDETENKTNRNSDPNSTNRNTCSSKTSNNSTLQNNSQMHSSCQSQNNINHFVNNTNNFDQSQSTSWESDIEDVTPFGRVNTALSTDNHSKLNGVQFHPTNTGPNYITKQNQSDQKHPLLSSENSNRKASIIVTTKDPLLTSEQYNSDYLLL